MQTARRSLSAILDEEEQFLLELRDVRQELDAIEGHLGLSPLRARLERRKEEILGHLERLEEEHEVSSR